MNKNFDEVQGKARDLIRWHAELDRGGPPMHQILDAVDGDFSGQYRQHLIDQVRAQLLEVSAHGHSVARTEREIATVEDPSIMVFFQLTGRSVFQQEGMAAAPLRPGDYTVTTTDTPYVWHHSPGDFAIFSMRFPESFIEVPGRALRSVTGQTLSSSTPLGRHVSPFVSSIARDAELLRGPLGARVARNLIDLMATGVAELVQRQENERPAPLLTVVTKYIDRNLADPSLSASAVAAGCHISARYLQMLFQEQGTTVTDFIRGRRLALCRQDLADPALRATPIGEIARLRGYPDQTYFARLFRRAYDVSPREWRAHAATARSVPTQPGEPSLTGILDAPPSTPLLGH